jgi:solute carrier family 12 sodium/potassium/chloride transporter 2
MLNIWGVMLFLRLTWVVGQAGILEGLAILVLSNIVTIITTISMSAVSTNGLVKGGGIYYMISRSLGPEFGGSIGLMFTVANSVAVSMYIIGFCESLLDMIYQFAPDFDGIISSIRIHDVRLIGSVSLVGILALAIVGMDWVTRVQKLLLVLLILSQLDFVIGTFLPPSAEERAKGFVGWEGAVASTNLWSDYRPDREGNTPTFFKVFAVFFPAVTGIVAGANLSGDLRDPSYAIPKGTFAAIGTTFVTYFVYFIMVGCVSVKYASGRLDEVGFGLPGYNQSVYAELNVTQAFDDCEGRTCSYGAAVDQQMMEVMSAWGPLIYAGCFAATLSSAIASLVGAPRVLQALAKDRLYPFIETFATGWGVNNDPIRGYVFVFAISLVCILIGDLNVVSGLLSNFFVATYALINFSVFHASITKSPGWRPSFK